MYRRLKIRFELLDSQLKFNFNVVEGDYNGIFVDILGRAGGALLTDEEWNKQCLKGYQFWLVVHSIENFLCGGQNKMNSDFSLAQDLLKSTGDENEEILPIVHVSTTSAFLPSMYTMAPLHRYVPRYHQIIDSSIWNYHVSIFEPHEISFPEDDPNTKFVKENIKSFRESFIDAISSIKKNYDRYLYGLEVAREYADLNARMASQAYLIGSHAKGVSPFVFHSEGAVKLMIKNEFWGDGGIIEYIRKQKWRILLLDDKAKTKMRCVPQLIPPKGDMYEGGREKLPWNCKLSIIEKALTHCFGWDSEANKMKVDHQACNCNCKPNKECHILIEFAESLQEAEEAIKTKKYDLILFDYLLDQTDGIHYGYELLDLIYKDQYRHRNDEDSLIYKTIKPHRAQRMYGMFISAYSSAVHDQLLAEGFNLSEKYWFINLGACPTNTPQLFLYNMLKLMDKRLDDSGILELSSDSIHNLVHKIFLPKDADLKRESVRKRANTYYQKVLSLQYHYRNILKDIEIPFGQNASDFDTKGSVLMTNFIQKKINLGGMLEHLTQLVHLTAFGTIRQCQEMWEEYIYFKALFEKQLDDVTHDDFNTMCQNIEKYILELKSQQQ